LIKRIIVGGKLFRKYIPNLPNLLDQSNCKKEVGSSFYILANNTTGLDKKTISKRPAISIINLVNAK